MKWYVAQVKTGRELEVRDYLHQLNLPAKVPRERRSIRQGSKWVVKECTLLPGHVFVGSDGLTAEEYYTAMALSGVIKLLGATKPEPISYLEAEYLALLAPTDEPLQPSMMKDDQVTDGPLVRLQSQVEKLDLRRRRAKVNLSILGVEQTVELAINLEGSADEVPDTSTS